MIFVSEERLRQAAVEYIRHYNTERPHQGIGNVTVGPWHIGTGLTFPPFGCHPFKSASSDRMLPQNVQQMQQSRPGTSAYVRFGPFPKVLTFIRLVT